MIINNLIDFIKKIENKRLLSLDVSKNRIGLAITDDKLIYSLPMKVIHRTKFLKDIQIIQNIYNEYNCGGIVIGYPLEVDDSEGYRCQSIRAFAKLFLSYYDVPIFFENEQYSTYAAKDITSKINKSSKKPIDDSASAYFLQSLLDKIQNIN